MKSMLALFNAALGLTEPWHVTSTEFSAGERRLDVSVAFRTGSKFICPHCNRSGCPVHDTVEKRWRHLDFFQHQAFITANVPRIDCENCGVKMVSVPWARHNSGFTLLMEMMILELVKHMPVAPLARMMKMNDKRIWNVIAHYVENAVDCIDMSQVSQVGVDETSAKRGHDYMTMVYDLVARRLLHVSEGKDQATIESFAASLCRHKGDPLNITEVSADMSPAFAKGVHANLPNAEITYDRFHVTKLLTDAVDKVRRSEMQKDKTIKGSRYAMLKNPENLTQKQKESLEDIQKRNARLAEAYRLKETFRDFYKQIGAEAAEGFLKGWVISAEKSGIASMEKVAKTIRRKWQGIIRWHITHITNSVMESLNGLVQAAKRKARGYRTFTNLRLMAFLVVGNLDLKSAL